jgi:hemoglobin
MNSLILLAVMTSVNCPQGHRAMTYYRGPVMVYPAYSTVVIAAAPAAAKEKSLYDRLGGEAAIKAVVDDFVMRAAGDPKVNFTRKGTAMEWKATPEKIDHLKKMLVQMIGQATGGPQKYEGRGMKEVHKGMMITNAEFDALAGDLKATLDKFKVPQKEQQELLKIVGSTRGEIVEKK